MSPRRDGNPQRSIMDIVSALSRVLIIGLAMEFLFASTGWMARRVARGGRA